MAPKEPIQSAEQSESMDSAKLIKHHVLNLRNAACWDYQLALRRCPRLIGSCLDLASPTRGRILAAFTAACLQTHLASRQEKRVMIITVIEKVACFQSSRSERRIASAVPSAQQLPMCLTFNS